MTNDEANQLRRGEVVFVGIWFSGTPPRVQRLPFLKRVSSHTYQLQDGSAYPDERLHYTEAEARKDVSRLISAKIIKLQKLLQEWETL